MFRELNTRLISNISYYRSCDYGLPKNLYKDINLDPTVDKFGQENVGEDQAKLVWKNIETCSVGTSGYMFCISCYVL